MLQTDPEKPDPINNGGLPDAADKPPSGCTGVLWHHKSKRESPRNHNRPIRYCKSSNKTSLAQYGTLTQPHTLNVMPTTALSMQQAANP